MSQMFVSPRQARTLVIASDRVTMVDVESDTEFAPRAHEIRSFFESCPSEIAADDLESGIARFERDLAAEKALQASLAILDRSTPRRIRLLYAAALEEMLHEDGVGTELLRRLLGVDQDPDLFDIGDAVQLSAAGGAPFVHAVVLALSHKLPEARKIFDKLKRGLSHRFAEPAYSLVLEAVQRSFLVGDFIAFGDGILPFGRLSTRMAHLLSELPPEIAPTDVGMVLSKAMPGDPHVTQPSIEDTHYRIGALVYAQDALQDAETPSLADSFSDVMESLFEAGSRNEEPGRWRFLLELGLAADPSRNDIWRLLLEDVRAEGDLLDAARLETFLDTRLSLFSSALARHVPPAGWKQRNFWKTTMPVPIVPPEPGTLFVAGGHSIHHRGAEADQFDLLRQIIAMRQVPDPARRLAYLLEAADKTPRQTGAAGSRHVELKRTQFSLGFGVHPDGPAHVATLSPEALLARISVYAGHYENDAVAAALARLIDDSSSLSETEERDLLTELEFSPFYAAHHITIERCRALVPRLAFALLGKLIAGSTSGGSGADRDESSRLLS